MSEALSQFPLPWLMAVALGLFLFSFAGIVFHAFSPSARPTQKYLANLPLEEEENG